MAEKKAWFGSHGPFLYDDTDVYQPDPDNVLTDTIQDLTLIESVRAEGNILLNQAPTLANHSARKGELDAVVSAAPMVLEESSTIDGKVVGQTSLHIPTTDVIITDILVVLESVVAITTFPTYSIGQNGSFDDVFLSEVMPPLTSSFNLYKLPITNIYHILANGEDLKIDITSGAVGTTFDFKIRVIGFPK